MSANSTVLSVDRGHGRRGAGLHERLALQMGADLQQVLGWKNMQGIDQGSGGHALQKTVAIRTHLTHPKSVAGVSLSEEHLKHEVAASDWWKLTVFAMFDACDEGDQYWRAKLSAL